MLHGWQDNAGSFDTLIPHLPSNYSYLAIDWPGHGLSSHFPKGCFYHMNDMALILEEIRVKLKWKQISVIAHSMGVVVSFIYASLFPSRIDFMCGIDTLRPPPRLPINLAMSHMKKLYVLYNEFIEEPEYTHDEIKERIYKSSLKSVNQDKIDYLMKRGVKSTSGNPSRFQFTLDIRARYLFPLIIEHEVSMHYIKQVKAAYLFIKSEDRTYEEPEEMFHEALEQFKEYNPRFEIIRCKGTHHLHLNDPTLISNEISEFLTKYYVDDQQAIGKL